MRWQDERQSDNVEDVRGSSFTGGGLRIGGLGLILIIIFSVLTGQNPLRLLGMLEQQTNQQQTTPAPSRGTGVNDEQKQFVSAVLASTEDVWGQQFSQMNRQYDRPKLVLFSDQVPTACGFSSAAVGPFYCPGDQKVYLDLTFFRELDQKFGAPGDFAQAYVIAHEIGHHVQNELGIMGKADQMRSGSEEQANAVSVRLELQADCLAGVWGYHANQDKKMLEPGDVDEGLRAAASVGDDRIQEMSGRAVSPETWTHGSSEMRTRWFKRGFESGDINSCDTFRSAQL